MKRYRRRSCKKRSSTPREREAKRFHAEAPTRSAAAKICPNIAKFRDTLRTPSEAACSMREATMNSTTPLGASGERRMTSRESPVGPQGTKDSRATMRPSPSWADTRTVD